MPVASAADHLETVFAVLDGKATSAESTISASWKRSATRFNIDPDSARPPRILTAYEVSECRARIGKLIAIAQEEIDHLYRAVSRAGYVVLLCDENGIAIDHRGTAAEAERYSYWGAWLGGVWSEDAEGTNGVGTCIAERRPLTIHQSQHFRSRHISLSCSAAPIFGSHDELLGVLDIASIDPLLSENSHALAGALVINSARAIEERLFREQHRRNWVIGLITSDTNTCPVFLAVDKEQKIVGADHNSHEFLSRRENYGGINSSLWDFFERDDQIFRAKNSTEDVHIRLFQRGSTLSYSARITPPESPAAAWRSSLGRMLHSRPRLQFATNMHQAVPPEEAKGGLPPKTLRRVQEYIDSHLNENIDLEILAALSGLSLHYFARAFKQSTGIPPYGYVLRRRLDKARELLVRTDVPLADIALATGFSDQSHLARHFRQTIGVSPGIFRRSHR